MLDQRDGRPLERARRGPARSIFPQPSPLCQSCHPPTILPSPSFSSHPPLFPSIELRSLGPLLPTPSGCYTLLVPAKSTLACRAGAWRMWPTSGERALRIACFVLPFPPELSLLSSGPPMQLSLSPLSRAPVSLSLPHSRARSRLRACFCLRTRSTALADRIRRISPKGPMSP
jgi:hypothetical protein